MNRPLSQLLHTDIQQGDDRSPRVITLHDHGQRGIDVQDHGLAANPGGRVIALESYKGVFVGKCIVGYTWFIGPTHRPSPIYFGDALAEIERFLWDEIDRQTGTDAPDGAALPFLLGVGQGAIMALATAAAVPDLLSGVIAIDGTFPVVPGWEPPLAPLDDLPVLLLTSTPSRPARPGVLSEPALSRTFRDWGARVTRSVVAPKMIPGGEMAGWVAALPVRRMVAGSFRPAGVDPPYRAALLS